MMGLLDRSSILLAKLKSLLLSTRFMTAKPIVKTRLHHLNPNPIEWIAVTLLTVVALTGCTVPSQPPTSGKPKVVVTNTVLCDLTRQVADSTIDLICLLAPGRDPHLYKLTPADRQSIEDAQLILYGGYDFEPELIKVIRATSNPAPKVAVFEIAVPQPQKFLTDGKSTIDPHVWHNARHGVKMVESIAKSLAKIAPEKVASSNQNIQRLTSEIDRIDTWIKSQISTIPSTKRILFTTHDSLGYYSKAYGIPVDALEGLSTEEKPNAARAKQLIDKIKIARVPTIFTELSLNPQLINTIAKEANVKVADRQIYADGLGADRSSGATYQQMLIANTQTIVEGLGGKFTPFANK
jgi:manganese/iron transport system substrate-binding protein